jgi:hypothetical protein
MSLLCAIGGHEAAPREVYNGGYYFSRCRRCGEDMVRTGASWDLVPEGHRVVWKSGRHNHSIEPDYDHALPVLHPAANLPMVRPNFSSWSRALARRRKAAAAPAPDVQNEVEEPHYPPLLVIAAIVGAGLQWLFGIGQAPRPFA